MIDIIFAAEEKELFKLLFMRDRTEEEISYDGTEIEPVVDMIIKNTGLGRDDALKLHLGMWTFVHGIAVMVVTSYWEWNIDLASEMLSKIYNGLIVQFCGEK